MAVLTKTNGLAYSGDRSPLSTLVRPDRVGNERARHGIRHPRPLTLVEPGPTAQQRDHVAGEAMHRPQVSLVRAVKILPSQGTQIGLNEFSEKALCLRRKERAPARLTRHLMHEDAGQHEARQPPHQLTNG